jgi:hypothetical protein
MVRRLYAGELRFADVAARDFENEEESLLGLGVLRETFFPELTVEVVELLDTAGERVVARIRVHLGPGKASCDAVQIWRFRGDEVAGIWSLGDSLPWLQELGVVPGDEEIERRLDEADATRRRRSPRA